MSSKSMQKNKDQHLKQTVSRKGMQVKVSYGTEKMDEIKRNLEKLM